MSVVSRITIFPMKSFDGLSRDEAEVLPSGALRHDRQFALADSTGKFINAKRTALIHQVHLLIDPEQREFTASRREGGPELRGQLDAEGRQLSDWLSQFFSLDVSIIENDKVGFPDDLEAPGPTVVSVATLETVAGWFPGLTVDNIRQRFRANVEIDGVEPFWEDRLFREDKQPQPFRIGNVDFAGTNPCRRCVVPTRDPLTGLITPDAFAKQFQRYREATLPPWSPRSRFDHFYRLTTNTCRIGHEKGLIHVGDAVEIR
jgi:uncharacterized protein YcbX